MLLYNKLRTLSRNPYCIGNMQVTFYGLQFFYDDEVEYPAGHILLREGQCQTSIYVLKKGSVKILKDGHEIALCDKRGDMFGEISVLTGAECTSTVKVNEDSHFFVIEDSEEFLVQNPHTTLFIAKMLAQRLTATTKNQSLFQKEVLELSKKDERCPPR